MLQIREQIRLLKNRPLLVWMVTGWAYLVTGFAVIFLAMGLSDNLAYKIGAVAYMPGLGIVACRKIFRETMAKNQDPLW